MRWVVLIGVLAAAAVAARGDQEAAPEPAGAVGPAKVMVEAFAPAAEDRRDWLGNAVRDTVTDELTRGGGVQLIAAAGKAQTPDEALAEARRGGAQVVIFGIYQIDDGNLRITGQMVDVATGQVVGALRSSGSLRDLFGMEDALAAQVRRQLPRIEAAPAVRAGADAAIAAPQPAATQASPGDESRTAAELNAYRAARRNDYLLCRPYFHDSYHEMGAAGSDGAYPPTSAIILLPEKR